MTAESVFPSSCVIMPLSELEEWKISAFFAMEPAFRVVICCEGDDIFQPLIFKLAKSSVHMQSSQMISAGLLFYSSPEL